MKDFEIPFVLVALAVLLSAQLALPLLSTETTHALTGETNGDVAMRNLEEIARRRSTSRRSSGAYGLSGVEILSFPADGEIY